MQEVRAGFGMGNLFCLRQHSWRRYIVRRLREQGQAFTERFEITGVVDSNKVVTDFFNQLHNPQKVNRSVLVDSDVRIVEVDGKDVIYINVPEADYRQKPIYINQKLEQGTYKRGHEGDRQVTKEELSLLLRDSSDNTDSQIIEHYGMDDIDAETLEKYRRSFNILNPGHAYEELNDRDFLIQMVAMTSTVRKALRE